eukprot:1849424-Rhodomonas_salina.2
MSVCYAPVPCLRSYCQYGREVYGTRGKGTCADKDGPVLMWYVGVILVARALQVPIWSSSGRCPLPPAVHFGSAPLSAPLSAPICYASATLSATPSATLSAMLSAMLSDTLSDTLSATLSAALSAFTHSTAYLRRSFLLCPRYAKPSSDVAYAAASQPAPGRLRILPAASR